MRTLLATAAVAFAALTGPAFAEGGQPKLLDVKFSFEGPFGTYDYHAVQRGYYVYREVCAACHSLSLVAYRNLQQIGLSEAAVKAIAADVQIRDLNDAGEMVRVPAGRLTVSEPVPQRGGARRQQRRSSAGSQPDHQGASRRRPLCLLAAAGLRGFLQVERRP